MEELRRVCAGLQALSVEELQQKNGNKCLLIYLLMFLERLRLSDSERVLLQALITDSGYDVDEISKLYKLFGNKFREVCCKVRSGT